MPAGNFCSPGTGSRSCRRDTWACRVLGTCLPPKALHKIFSCGPARPCPCPCPASLPPSHHPQEPELLRVTGPLCAARFSQLWEQTHTQSISTSWIFSPWLKFEQKLSSQDPSFPSPGRIAEGHHMATVSIYQALTIPQAQSWAPYIVP